MPGQIWVAPLSKCSVASMGQALASPPALTEDCSKVRPRCAGVLLLEEASAAAVFLPGAMAVARLEVE